jgi:hypothetical protein
MSISPHTFDGVSDWRALYGTAHSQSLIYLENMGSLYGRIFTIIRAAALRNGCQIVFAQSTSDDGLGIEVVVQVSRAEETMEMDFGRLVGMLEKQGTFDLDLTELRRYIDVTCALLPQTPPPSPDERLQHRAALTQMAQSSSQAKAQVAAQALQQMAFQQGQASSYQQHRQYMAQLQKNQLSGITPLTNIGGMLRPGIMQPSPLPETDLLTRMRAWLRK